MVANPMACLPKYRGSIAGGRAGAEDPFPPPHTLVSADDISFGTAAGSRKPTALGAGGASDSHLGAAAGSRMATASGAGDAPVAHLIAAGGSRKARASGAGDASFSRGATAAAAVAAAGAGGGWMEAQDPASGNLYWYNSAGVTTWTNPIRHDDILPGEDS